MWIELTSIQDPFDDEDPGSDQDSDYEHEKESGEDSEGEGEDEGENEGKDELADKSEDEFGDGDEEIFNIHGNKGKVKETLAGPDGDVVDNQTVFYWQYLLSVIDEASPSEDECAAVAALNSLGSNGELYTITLKPSSRSLWLQPSPVVL